MKSAKIFLLSIFSFSVPILALAHPQIAELDCTLGNEIHLTVSDSPMGDGGFYLTLGKQNYEVDQDGYSSNVDGNVVWGEDQLPAKLTTISYSSAQHKVALLLTNVPLYVKYDFSQMPNGYFEHQFIGNVSATIGDTVVNNETVFCQYTNIAGMND
jgi:hypothetical protein